MSVTSLRSLFDAGRLWQGASTPDIPVRTTGFQPLDSALSAGGWPAHLLIEILTDQPESLPIQCVLPSWQQYQDTRWLGLINPPAMPSAEGLQQAGIPPEKIDLVNAGTDTPWALEQLCRSPVMCSVLAWHDETLSHTQLRRLQLACQQGETQLFLVRESNAQRQPSPAPLRIQLAQSATDLAIQILKQPGRHTQQQLTVALTHPWSHTPPPRSRRTSQPQTIQQRH